MASINFEGNFLSRRAIIHFSHRDIVKIDDAVETSTVIGSLLSAATSEPISGAICAVVSASWFIIKRTDRRNGSQGCTIVLYRTNPVLSLWIPVNIY